MLNSADNRQTKYEIYEIWNISYIYEIWNMKYIKNEIYQIYQKAIKT